MPKIYQNKRTRQYFANLPKKVVEALRWGKGTEFEVNVGDDRITLLRKK